MMNEILESLAVIPGVRATLLVSPDGVPVLVRGKNAGKAGEGSDTASEESPESLAALATGWLSGVASSVAPLSWTSPTRVVMRAARGTLVMVHAPGAVLLVVLNPGGSPEDLRLPMDGAVRRMERKLRQRRERRSTEDAAAQPDAALPAPKTDKGRDPVQADTTSIPSPKELPG
jgi:predicted regulator of Ras-like GTPase activity (Roadblock/LC7/MglB family)